jgi:hypothetical protein
MQRHFANLYIPIHAPSDIHFPNFYIKANEDDSVLQRITDRHPYLSRRVQAGCRA